jgi:hypothetical protein
VFVLTECDLVRCRWTGWPPSFSPAFSTISSTVTDTYSFNRTENAECVERVVFVSSRYGNIVGTDVKVPNGLNRNPTPVRPLADELWNSTIPRLPLISGSLSAKPKDV